VNFMCSLFLANLHCFTQSFLSFKVSLLFFYMSFVNIIHQTFTVNFDKAANLRDFWHQHSLVTNIIKYNRRVALCLVVIFPESCPNSFTVYFVFLL